jgi:hypothetical protein
VLYRYDTEQLSFKEAAYYNLQQGLSQIVTKLEEGTYVLLIESLSSTSEKFTTVTHSQLSAHEFKRLVPDPCLTVNYSYYISTTYDEDLQKVDFFDMLASIFGGFIPDSAKQREFDHYLNQELGEALTECSSDELPLALEGTESGYDLSYRVQIPKVSSQEIQIIVLEDSLLKVMTSTTNHKGNINMFLYRHNDDDQAIAISEPDFDYKTI